MAKRKKVLITSAVPLNNGDAALVFSLADSLLKLGYHVTISTYYFNEVSRIYKNYNFVREILDYNIFKKLPFLKKTYIKIYSKLIKSIRKYDFYIASPGGYINNYYGFSHTFEFLRQMQLKGKPIGVYAQSVGPLSYANMKVFKYYQQYIDIIYVRDIASFNEIKENTNISNFKLVEDGAFLLEPMHYDNPKTNIVAISVRAWKFDQRDESIYIELIKSFIEYLVELKYEIVFLSTCQGVKNYTDDTKMAKEILKKIPRTQSSACTIDYSYYTLEKLRYRLNDFDFIIGTRLHMCILSLLNGIPAFNISYERKGKEAYDSLKLGNYSCDYNENSMQALQKLKQFISEQTTIKKAIAQTIYEKHTSAQNNLVLFMNILNEKIVDRI